MPKSTDPPVQQSDPVEFNLNWHFEVDAGVAIFYLEGKEVFRSSFNEANLAEAIYEKVKTEKIYLQVPDSRRESIIAKAHKRLSESGSPLTAEEIEALMPEALLVFGQRLQQESLNQAAHQIQEQLPSVLLGMLTDITHGAFFSGANKLRDTLEVPDQKFTEKHVKQALFDPAWERIKPLFNLPTSSQGGARNIKHNWTEEDCACLAEKYQELRPVWLDAKEIARESQKSRIRNRKKEWRNEVLRVYPTLPPDLLEHFSVMRGSTKPSDLALIHASRLCNIAPGLSAKRLREKIKEWKIKSSD